MAKKNIFKLSICLILVAIFSVTCFFYKAINKGLLNFLFNKFNVLINSDDLLVHFIDVGQGDAIAINLPNNEIMLIDCGPESRNVEYTKYLTEKVLNSRKNKIIDYLILTHADADHIGGALKVFNNFDVEKVYMPTVESDSNTYIEMKTFVENNCNFETITKESTFIVENCKIEIFGLYDINDTNDSSPVVKISYLGKSFMFMADISAEVEDELINDYGDKLNCDVLKIAHHGSGSSSSVEFLELASPEYAVISVGQNSYGHPTEQVLMNIKAIDAKILRTDADENIVFIVNESNSLKYKTQNFYITETKLNYVAIVIVLDVTLLTYMLVIIIKNYKKKKRIKK